VQLAIAKLLNQSVRHHCTLYVQAVVVMGKNKTVLHKSTSARISYIFGQTLEMFILYEATIRSIAARLFVYLCTYLSVISMPYLHLIVVSVTHIQCLLPTCCTVFVFVINYGCKMFWP
jgi:hypothetical protein